MFRAHNLKYTHTTCIPAKQYICSPSSFSLTLSQSLSLTHSLTPRKLDSELIILKNVMEDKWKNNWQSRYIALAAELGSTDKASDLFCDLINGILSISVQWVSWWDDQWIIKCVGLGTGSAHRTVSTWRMIRERKSPKVPQGYGQWLQGPPPKKGKISTPPPSGRGRATSSVANVALEA
jgi:hypothetical protein